MICCQLCDYGLFVTCLTVALSCCCQHLLPVFLEIFFIFHLFDIFACSHVPKYIYWNNNSRLRSLHPWFHDWDSLFFAKRVRFFNRWKVPFRKKKRCVWYRYRTVPYVMNGSNKTWGYYRYGTVVPLQTLLNEKSVLKFIQ